MDEESKPRPAPQPAREAEPSGRRVVPAVAPAFAPAPAAAVAHGPVASKVPGPLIDPVQPPASTLRGPDPVPAEGRPALEMYCGMRLEPGTFIPGMEPISREIRQPVEPVARELAGDQQSQPASLPPAATGSYQKDCKL